jgi:hypothetical protein
LDRFCEAWYQGRWCSKENDFQAEAQEEVFAAGIDSSFFRSFSTLPTPGEVRTQAKVQCVAGTGPDKRKQLPAPGLKFVSAPPVVFESKGVFVKWGHDIRVSEAQCLYALNRFLMGAVPVPELYGWRTENECVYIYMQALHGRTLELVWDALDHDSRNAVCEQLHTIFNNLRQLEQSPDDAFIGITHRTSTIVETNRR